MVSEHPAIDMRKISIAKDFSDTPVGRYPSDGKYNGESFREDYLVPALRAEDRVTVNIDDAEGYGSSFLDEAFGGLIRKGHFTVAQIEAKLTIECLNPDYDMFKRLIWKYIKEAKRE